MNRAEALAERWKELTDSIPRAYAEREMITRELYAMPGMTQRKVAGLLGISSVAVNKILHRGEPRPGTIRKEAGR
jgi:DNA-binding transcriptional regulator LsrR (DeoR family)